MKIAVAILLLGAPLVWGCGPAADTADEGDATVIEVTAAQVTRAELPTYVEVGGIVQPRSTAFVSSRVMATVEAVSVAPGSRVVRGQMLVALDGRELAAHAARATAGRLAASEAVLAAEATAEAAEADLRLAEVTFTRISGLHDRQSATRQELDRALAARDAAVARARAARAARAAAASSRDAAVAAEQAASVTESYAVLTAPFDGVVAERLVDEGALALPGAPLLLLEEDGAFRLDARIDDAGAPQLAPGTRAEVRVDGAGADWIPASVVEVGRSDPATHSFLVTLEIDGPVRARSGSFGRARFAWETRSTLVVPAGSVVRRGQLAFVYLVDADGRARLRPVVTGAASDGDVEVLSGLQAGDMVVAPPPPTLADGAAVRIAPAGTPPDEPAQGSRP